MPSATVVKLPQGRMRRLERRLDLVEQRVRDLGDQLDQATDVLTRLVRVVAMQNRQTRKTLDRLELRIERMHRAVTTGRTADLRRVNGLERRLAILERRLS
ncbi:MAG TPA: hypothetical protein VMS22_01960 [Candidatus Eisenbacteria bacterium]|nr:hypothetical protein [Candidatus Eisenbacteria bacterium]